ncbi:MAG: MFS transporter [Microlunatus sp.]
MALAAAGLSVFRSRDFSLLWFGGLASYTGMWAMLIALPLYVFQQTGSALAAGAVATAQFAPRLFASVAGVLVDRWDRRRALVTANLAMAVLTLPLAIPAATGASGLALWIVYTSVILVSVSGLVVGPAENALLPTLVEPNQLLTANAMNALNDNLARIAGPAIGGAVAAFVGLSGVVALNATTYAIAALLIWLIRGPGARLPVTNEPTDGAGTGFLGEWVTGIRQVQKSRAVLVVFVAAVVVLLGDSMLSALLAPFVDQNFANAAVTFGLLLAARGAGGLVGSLLTGLLGGMLPPRHRLGGTAVVAGGLVAVFVLVSRVPVAVAAFGLLGVLAVVWGASIQTTIQSGVPNAYLGRAFGSFSTVNAAAMTLGSAIAAVASGPLGVSNVLVVAAGLYVASGIVAYLTFPRESGEPWRPWV